MCTLGVNIDHVATIREARRTNYPDILQAAREAIKGGADQITVHLREDRRHIHESDLFRLKKGIDRPLNMEMSVSREIVSIALELSPDTATIVPERREELTTEGGLDVANSFDQLKECIHQLKSSNIAVSFFIDPDVDQISASKELRADSIELHTGYYSNALSAVQQDRELERLQVAASFAKKIGLRVAAGHGLHYGNIEKLVRSVPEIEEYNVGHSIVARAIFVGIAQAVREMACFIKGRADV